MTRPRLINLSCILSKFYIKPQLHRWNSRFSSCCILSKFYIKPQLTRIHSYSAIVVSYRNSTSNHNRDYRPRYRRGLYLIEILHQTTTVLSLFLGFCCCILSKFYIKPQPRGVYCLDVDVVSYRNSTSNHNKPDSGKAHRLVVSYRNSTSNHNRVAALRTLAFVVSYRNSTSNHNVGPHID